MKQIAEYKVTTGQLCPSLLEWSYDELTLGLIQTCIPNREKMPIYYPLVNKGNAEIVNHTTQIKDPFFISYPQQETIVSVSYLDIQPCYNPLQQQAVVIESAKYLLLSVSE